MENKRPVGRPRKTKTIVLEWIGHYWLGTAFGGLVWLYFGGAEPAKAMLLISGMLWWLGSLVDVYWP